MKEFFFDTIWVYGYSCESILYLSNLEDWIESESSDFESLLTRLLYILLYWIERFKLDGDRGEKFFLEPFCDKGKFLYMGESKLVFIALVFGLCGIGYYACTSYALVLGRC